MSINVDNTWTKIITWHFSTTPCDLFSRINTTEVPALASSGHLRQPWTVRFDSSCCLIWTHGLDSSQPNQRVESFSLCRQYYPLSSPINRGGFHGLSMKKIGCKIGWKSASPPQFFCNKFSLFFLSPPWPSATTTLTTGLNTIVSTNPDPH